jgi:iron complex transport system ATP-binding protein
MSILGQERWNVFELRSMLGVVSNDLMSALTGEATGLDVLLSGFFSSIAIYSNHQVSSQQKDLAHETLAQLQVPHLADRSVNQMSSGEAKRILIARALVHRPRALLFDEPSNSLDATARHSLRQTMSLLVNSGIGVLMVTHDLSDIVPEINRVVLMRAGRIVADGQKEVMLTTQRLGDLFATKVEVARREGFYHLW